MYWLIVIPRKQRDLLSIIWTPDCIFIVHVKKWKNMSVPVIIYLFLVEAEACSKQTQLYLLWFVQSKTYFDALCIFILVWFICSRWSCCQACLWLADFSKVALTWLCLWCTYDHTLRQKAILSSFQLFAFFRLWFVLTLLCTWKMFFVCFSPFKTKSLVK